MSTTPQYIGAGTSAAGTGAVVPTVASEAVDDLLLLVTETGAEAVTAPTGPDYLPVPGAIAIQNGTRLTAFYRWATSAAETDPTVPDPGDHVYARIFTFRGVSKLRPFGSVAVNQRSNDATGVASMPGVATDRPNTMIVNVWSWSSDTAAAGSSGEANASLSSVAERSDEGTTLGNGGGFALITGEKATAGNVDQTTANTLGGYSTATLTIVLNPGADAAHTVAGTVTIDGANAADGGTVNVWDTVLNELVGVATIAGGAGAFTVNVPFGNLCIAVYDNGTRRGVSAAALPESGTFNITIESAGGVTTPQMVNIEPDENEAPGSPGAFSATFSVARLTPIEFDLEDFPAGMEPVVLVKFANRNEMYTAFDYNGAGVWPFDIEPDSEITGSGTKHVKLLPRGGWPNTEVFVQAGAGIKAV